MADRVYVPNGFVADRAYVPDGFVADRVWYTDGGGGGGPVLTTTAYAGLNVVNDYYGQNPLYLDRINGGEWWSNGSRPLYSNDTDGITELDGAPGAKESWPSASAMGSGPWFKRVGLRRDGTYTLAWQGNGAFNCGGPVNESVDTAVDGTPGSRQVVISGITEGPNASWFEATVTSSDGSLRFQLYETSLAADFANYAFYPDRMTAWAEIGPGCIRTMNWNEPGWDDLSTELDHLNAGSAGESEQPNYWFMGLNQRGLLQSSIDIANQMDCDLWYCLPPKASDNYITEMAQAIFAPNAQGGDDPSWKGQGLRANRRVYLELGNEIWNGSIGTIGEFPAPTTTVQQQYMDGVVTGDPTNSWWSDVAAAGQPITWLRYQSVRSMQIHQEAERIAVLNGYDASRVVRVIANQLDQSQDLFSWSSRLLGKPDTVVTPVSGDWITTPGGSGSINRWQWFDLLAVNVYFAGNPADESPDPYAAYIAAGGTGNQPASLNQTFDWIFGDGDYAASGALDYTMGQFDTAAALMRSDFEGLPIGAYEGGQHLIHGDTDWLRDASNDVSERMGTAYTEMLTRYWDAANTNATVFCHFEAEAETSNFGAWGIKESWTDATSQKWAAWTGFAWPTP